MKGRKPKAAAAAAAAGSKKADNKLAVKKGGGAKTKDSNKPKRPPSAFLVFMEDFRKQFKEKNPENKSVATVGKAGGVKWRAMTDADKATYHSKVEKLKVEYQKNMKAYEKGLQQEPEENLELEGEESDKSKSEVNSGSEEEEEEDD